MHARTHAQSVTFFGITPGFATICVALSCFHNLFRTLLSYVIHFSLPVMSRFKNDSILFRFSDFNDLQMEIPLNFSLLDHMAPKHPVFFIQYPVFFKWFKTVLWSMFSSLPILWLLMCSTFSMISTFPVIDRPERDALRAAAARSND